MSHSGPLKARRNLSYSRFHHKSLMTFVEEIYLFNRGKKTNNKTEIKLFFL